MHGLLAQYVIIFQCMPCSKVINFVSVAAFLRAYVGALAPLADHGSLVLVLRKLGKPQWAGQWLLSML